MSARPDAYPNHGPNNHRRMLHRAGLLLGMGSLVIALAACEGTDDAGPVEEGNGDGAAAGETASDDEGSQAEDAPEDGAAGGEPADQEDGTGETGTEENGDEPTDAAETDEELNPVFTENEVYSWNLPAGYTADIGVSEDTGVSWANGEPTQTVEIFNAEEQQVGNMTVNIETGDDGIPFADRQVIDVEEIPGASQDESQTVARSVLQADCLVSEVENEEAAREECGYVITFTFLSVPPGDDPWDPDGEAWVFQHEIEGEDYAGNIMSNFRIPAETWENGDNGFELEGIPYEEAQALQESDEYDEIWDLVTSFSIHESGSAQ